RGADSSVARAKAPRAKRAARLSVSNAIGLPQGGQSAALDLRQSVPGRPADALPVSNELDPQQEARVFGEDDLQSAAIPGPPPGHPLQPRHLLLGGREARPHFQRASTGLRTPV